MPNRKVSRLSAFQRDFMKWRQFPSKLPAEVKACTRAMKGSNNGLFLCESKNSISVDGGIGSYLDVGVWNPLLHSFTWLPTHPELIAGNLFGQCWTQYLLMVDEPSRTNKVFLRYHPPQTTGSTSIIHTTRFYSVYSSTSGSWSVSKPIPRNFVFWERAGGASCDRYIFFEGEESYLSNNGHTLKFEHCVFWYDAHMDSWNRVLLSKILTDLGYSPTSSTRINCFATLQRRLYMLIYKWGDDINYSNQNILASLDLTALGCDFEDTNASIMNLETVVPEILAVPARLRSACAFNIYTYTLKGKGFLCVLSRQTGLFSYFDVASGVWLDCDELEVRNWKDTRDRCYSFKPSLVVP